MRDRRQGNRALGIASAYQNLAEMVNGSVKAEMIANDTIRNLENGKKISRIFNKTFDATLKRIATIQDPDAPNGERLMTEDEMSELPDMSIKTGARLLLERLFIDLNGHDFRNDEYIQPHYERAQNLINDLDDSMPLVYYDYVQDQVMDAGYEIAEISGRKFQVRNGRLCLRDKPDRRDEIDRYQKGEALALFLNSGTGFDAHSGAQPEYCQRPIQVGIMDPNDNIRETIQVIMRFHRKGQAHAPSVEFYSTGTVVDQRKLVSFNDKLSMIGAITKGSPESPLKIDTVNILNSTGDKAAWNILIRIFSLPVVLNFKSSMSFQKPLI